MKYYKLTQEGIAEILGFSDGIVFSTEEKNMRVSQDKTLGELYEEIYEELFNKTFSFNNSVFLSNSILSEGTDYEEISEKEYKEHKVVTNFS